MSKFIFKVFGLSTSVDGNNKKLIISIQHILSGHTLTHELSFTDNLTKEDVLLYLSKLLNVHIEHILISKNIDFNILKGD